ncbi:unnamed protein product [Colletotrichum noveboracense]|uniref:RING-type domain-containing protein n=1 Tax=Colletotrichum noveboracense TaxID=2664923 RepID=A0A9W4RIB6_9PEZI|nr:hypothetical protein K456DRAFT_1728739 [Colletotrichum gloeosporioides 23]CAI0641807.1 unnamed protein product [Colletotrichum noveboracense]
MALAQIHPIASQNNEDVRFSTILSITQSLSVLDQIMPTHWIRRGITLHEDLRSWLTIDMQRPNAGSDEAFRNCVCAVDVPRKFYFAGCRHMACGDCARKSGRCCDRDQSMVLCYPPEDAECPICEDTKPILIFKCGHTMCQSCYLRLSSQPGNTLCPQCRADLGYGAIARFNPA